MYAKVRMIETGTKEDTQIREAENVAITLNDVADGLVIADAETKAIALTVLSGGDPAGRAAAGRAISAIDPTLAKDLLPDIIKNETNKFVRSVLRGALAAARL